MKKIANFIVNHPRSLILTYLILCIISLIGLKFVSIEYDLSAYLPKDIASYQGKYLLEEEFGMGGMASLMIESVDSDKLNALTAQIGTVDGVKEVIYIPENTKDGHSLINIVFSQGGSTQATSQSIDEIKEFLTPYTYYLGGESSISKDMQDTTTRELLVYSLLAFIIIAIVLLLGSKSYIEPIYFFATLGVAILINMGSNLIFGKISSNTNSVASILQLAVSMDYSIFLLHRYYEEKKRYSPKEAMANAIQKTFSSVSASALTTIGGFLALITMQYGIGKDMGLVLAKGVLLSLVGVLTLLPALILLIDSKFKLKEHRILIPSLGKLAPFFIKCRYIVLAATLIIAIPVFFAQSQVKYYYSNEKTLKDSAESISATHKINDLFGVSNQIIVITPLEVTDKLKDTMAQISALDGVNEAFGLYSIVSEKLPLEFIPKELIRKFQTDNYTYFAITLDAPMEGEETSSILVSLKEVLNENLEDNYYITGESVVYDDLKTVTSKDFKVVTIVSIVLVGIILAITFKSILLPIILLFIIQLGIGINLSIPYMMGTELNFISFIILGAIQLGATVDYAILFTSRYLENRSVMKKVEALQCTISDTSSAILTSALILIGGTLSVYLITTIRSAAELTLLIARGAMISLVLVYILLPAALYVCDRFIKKYN